MSRRRSPGHRDGLWDWTDTSAGAITPAEVRPNPLLVHCRVTACGAAIGEHCTIHTRRGRVRRSPHQPRIEDAARAAAVDHEPAEQPPSASAGAREETR
jgi:hypothetical protein